MISQIQIKNFQAHKDTVLDLSFGINVIAGSSDEGKSSIIRALNWAITNRPSGFAFKSDFAKDKEDTVVSLLTDDNVKISRVKSKTKNNYILCNDPKSDAVVFHALRSDVPEEISDVLCFGEYNIQTQFDPFFLLQGYSAGDVAKRLNELCGLTIIDDTLKNIDSSLRESNSELKRIKKTKDELLHSLNEYTTATKQDTILSAIEKQNKQLHNHRKTKQTLSDKLCSLEKHKKHSEEIRKWLSIEPEYNNLMSLITVAQELEIKKQKLLSLLVGIQKQQNKIKAREEWLSLESIYIPLSSVVSEWETHSKSRSKLQSLCTKLGRMQTNTQRLKKQANGESFVASLLDSIPMWNTQKNNTKQLRSKIDVLIKLRKGIVADSFYIEKEGTIQKTISKIDKCKQTNESCISLHKKIQMVTQKQVSMTEIEERLSSKQEELKQLYSSLNVCEICPIKKAI